MGKEGMVAKEVWFVLTPDEIVEKAKTAAELQAQALVRTEALKDYSKREKAEIEGQEVEARKLLRTIREGREIRVVKCEMRGDYSAKTMRFFFEGREVDSRPMTAEERQMTFDVIAGGKEGA